MSDDEDGRGEYDQDLPKCRACGAPFSFPEGQFTWTCGGCGMVIRRMLTAEETKKECVYCGVGGWYPKIAVEPSCSNRAGEPVLRYWPGCPACTTGQKIRQDMQIKNVPFVDHLPRYLEWRESGTPRYYWWVEDEFARIWDLYKHERIRTGQDRKVLGKRAVDLLKVLRKAGEKVEVISYGDGLDPEDRAT